MTDKLERSRLWKAVDSYLSQLGYTLKKRLSGHGSSPSNSRVWLAEYRNGEAQPEQRALKISSMFMIDDFDGTNLEKLDELTQREVEIMKRINHPNIPDFKSYHRIPFEDVAAIDVLAMGYIHKPNLLQEIQKRQRISESEAKRLLEDVLSALEHVHTGLGE